MKTAEVTFANGGGELINEIIRLEQLHQDLESLKKTYKQTKLAGMSLAIAILERQFNAQYLTRHQAMQTFCRKNKLDMNCNVEIDGTPYKGDFTLVFTPYEPEQEELL